jgi:hypothetical protein
LQHTAAGNCLVYMLKFILPTAGMLLLFCSCNTPRFVNSPTAINNPTFTQKGQASATVLYSQSDGEDGLVNTEINRGLDAQAAVAVTNHLFIAGAYSLRREKDVFSNTITPVSDPFVQFRNAKVDYRRKHAELGLGFYFPAGNNNKFVLKLMAGVGMGENRITDKGDSILYVRHHRATQRKIFFQPGFDLNFSPQFTFFVALKNAYHWYRNIKTDYTTAEQREINLLGLGGQTLQFTEFGYGIQFGYKNLPGWRINAHMNLLISDRNRSQNDPGIDFRSRWLNGSVGINYQFSYLRKQAE